MKNRYKELENVYTIILALLSYYIVIMGTMYIAGLILGTEVQLYNVRKMIGAAVTLPVLYYVFYKPDKILWMEDEKRIFSRKRGVISGVLALLLGVLLSVSLSNVVLWIFPMQAGSSYEEADMVLSSGSIVFQILNSVCVTPILEELLYRGIVYKRMRRISKEWVAVVASSAIFGIMHFNLQQFLFAFLLGIALSCLMKFSDKLLFPVICHMAGNLISICRNHYGILSFSAQRNWIGFLSTALMLLAGVLCFYGFYKKNKEE